MTKLIKKDSERHPPLVSTGHAVEASIDSSKAPGNQTWDQAAGKSAVVPWSEHPTSKKSHKA